MPLRRLLLLKSSSWLDLSKIITDLFPAIPVSHLPGIALTRRVLPWSKQG